MGTIHVIGETHSAKVTMAKALEDMLADGHDCVLVVMGTREVTDIRWSTMTNAQLAFLVSVAQAELLKRIGCNHE